MKPINISFKDARKIALHAQRVSKPAIGGRAIDATESVIQHLGYIQIDTISVIERAHHHTLWNRNPRYKHSQLDQLLKQRKIFEYWSHAAAYLPMENYRMCLPNMESVKDGGKLWFKADPKLKKEALKRIEAEGPLQSKDFGNDGKTNLSMWEWKPAKYALETLFMEGELMVTRRDKFQKVYDLRERVLPANIDITTPSPREFSELLVDRYLRAHGFGNVAEISYLRKGAKKELESALSDLHEDGKLIVLKIGDSEYYAQPDILDSLSKPLSRSKAKILSPFDNLVIQRKRMLHLFDFDYQIECYVPEKKRKFGYFSLPILWDAQFVGRVDCKADRKSETFIVKNLALEPNIKQLPKFTNSLARELMLFCNFNKCGRIRIDKVSDKKVKEILVELTDREIADREIEV